MIGCIVRVGFSLLCVFLMVIGISMLVMFDATLDVLGIILKTNFNHQLRCPSPLVPIWYDISDDLNFNNWLNPLSSASLTLFLIPLLQGMLGSLLVCHPRLWLAIIIGIAGLISVVTQSANFVQMYYLTSITHQSAMRVLKKVVAEKYEVVPGNPQTAAFNLIMIMGECCGVESPADFRNSRLSANFTLGVNPYENIKIPSWMDMEYAIPTPNISFQATFKYPPACCNSTLFNILNITKRFNEVVKCASDPRSKYRNRLGCYYSFFSTFVRNGYKHAYLSSLFLGILWTITGLLTPFVTEDMLLE